MEERMYSTQEVTEITGGAILYGGMLGVVYTLGGLVLIGGVKLVAGAIKEHIQKKKLEKTVDDFKNHVAEMD